MRRQKGESARSKSHPSSSSLAASLSSSGSGAAAVGFGGFFDPLPSSSEYSLPFVVIAERLSEEEIGGLKELFRMIDANNSGTIIFDELKEGLKQVGSELMESEIKDFMDAADNDNSGTIDYGEFIAAMVHLNKLEREENLVSAFSYFSLWI